MGSTAAGYISEATGQFSTALASLARAQQQRNCGGPGAYAQGEFTTALGTQANATECGARFGQERGQPGPTPPRWDASRGPRTWAPPPWCVGASDGDVRHCGGNAASAASQALALGTNATASGVQSVAAGVSAQATGQGATAVGDLARATGYGAASLGWDAQALQDDSVAIGAGSRATRAYTVSFGHTDGFRGQLVNIAEGTQDTMR